MPVSIFREEVQRLLEEESAQLVDVQLRQIPGHRWRQRKDFALSPALSRSQLRDQRAPACEEEPSLLRQRDMALTAPADTKVLSQLIERRAEPRC